MFRTRVQRALAAWAVIVMVIGFALEYGLGQTPLHPTNKFYHLIIGEPIGVRLPWHGNPGAQEAYDRLCGRLYAPMVHHRQVVMCVEDLMRADLRDQHRAFAAQVDDDYWRYRIEHAQKIGWALLYALGLWLLASVGTSVARWIGRGEKGGATNRVHVSGNDKKTSA